jgi:hypothetical protein
MSAPLKFAESAAADGVSILPQVRVRWGFFDLRWLGLLFFIVVSQIGGRGRRRARRNAIAAPDESETRAGASAKTAVNV